MCIRDRPLQHRPHGDGPRAALHALVQVVASVQVGHHEDRGAAGDLAAGHLGPGHGGVDRGVVLDRALHLEVGAEFADQVGGGADLVDVGARAGGSGRVREHGDPGIDAEPRGGAGRGDRDAGELLGGRVGVDRAVAVHQHPIGQAHEEHAGDQPQAQDLERGPDRVRGGVRRARHHAVGHAGVHHQGAEVGHVGDGVAGQLDGHPPVRPDRRVLAGEALAQLGVERAEHPGRVQVEAELGGPGSDAGLVAEQGQLGHAAP